MDTQPTVGYPMSPRQQHLWSSQEGSAGRSVCAVSVGGHLDVAALRRALAEVVRRHEILRTTFHRRPGMKVPLQVVGDEAVVDWQAIDLTAVAPAERDARLADLVRAEERRPCDLQQAPVRAVVASLDSNQHALILSAPALCADAASLEAVAREVLEVMQAAASGSASGTAGEPPVQYADFSQWHNELVEADDDESRAAKRFWGRPELSAADAPTLPGQRKPARGAAFDPDRVRVEVPAAPPASPSAWLLAGWQTLLWRLTGQADLVVRAVVDGRSQEDLKGAVGPFAKPVPVAAHLDNVPFADLVRQAGAALNDASRWQDYCTPAEGDTESENLPQFECTAAGSPELRTVYRSHATGRFPVKLVAVQDGGSVTAELHYDRAAFDRADAERLAGYFRRLLDGATRSPQTPAGKLEILDAAEREQVLVGFNRTAADYPRDRCVHDLFEEQAARNPQRPALAFQKEQYTYADLNARANQLAHLLRKAGVGRNVPVALCLERSADMVVGLLGILKAGGAYLPLDPGNPKARLAHQLTETKAPVVLTQEVFLDRLPPFEGQIVCLDRDRDRLAKEPNANPPHINDSADLVYVMYTSGSTGLPKGVGVRHGNLVNYTHFIGQRLRLNEVPGGLHFATVSALTADLGNTCVFPALVSGGCLHVIPYDTAMDGKQFGDYAARHPIDVLKITPSHLGALLATGEPKAVLPRRALILGGEAFTRDLAQRLTAVASCEVFNHYGPTETTVGVLTYSLRENPDLSPGSATVPVGKPIANARIYVLDPLGAPVPIGVPGELCIGGACLASGYLNQPKQTAERFVADPFVGDPSARMYRTGDRARWLPDGNVEFLGRSDDQVKIRGFRVELTEIEEVLRRHPAVQQAAVIAPEDKAGDRRLVAYVVPASGRRLDPEPVRAFLREHVPEYMVPATFVTLEALPLNPTGKVDRRALPSPDQAAGPARPYIAPRNPAEVQLAQIWGEVLKLDRVGIHEDFFELGGHSLIATQVISRVRSAMNVQLPLLTIFESRTVAGMAGVINQLLSEEAPDEEMKQLLQELDGLSEEEVQRLLAAEAAPGNG